MIPVSRAEERKLFGGLKRVFARIIKQATEGNVSADEMRDEGRRFLASEESEIYIRKIVSRMVKNVRVRSARSWREAAARGTNSHEIYNLIRDEMQGPVGSRVWQLIADNAAYIRTVPQEWADYIVKYVARESMKGKRHEDIETELRKVMPQHMTRNLKCIARTECAKANAAITQARAEACGIRAYFWRSVRDERSRSQHAAMEGILVFYGDPPSPEALFGGGKAYGNYHAGNTFNCRCFQEPVVDARFLPDTVRVHDHGKIRTMTKSALMKEYGPVA